MNNYEKIEGLVTIKALETLRKSMKMISKDLLEEGFETEDIDGFLKSLITKNQVSNCKTCEGTFPSEFGGENCPACEDKWSDARNGNN